MKKTLTVNLGGTVFHIDEDAYRLLDNYLCNLKLHFRKQEGAEEIVDDIEARISELFLEKLNAGSQVITLADVEEVIARVGKPEDFGTTDEEEKRTSSGTSAASATYTSRRRLYRNSTFAHSLRHSSQFFGLFHPVASVSTRFHCRRFLAPIF